MQTIIKLKPNLGHFQEDLKINGDRIGILDVSGRIREEYECSNIFPGNENSSKVYDQVLIPYLKASLEGVNVAVLAFGTSASGKSYTIQGDNNEPGVIHYFVQAMFEGLETKKKMLSEGRRMDKTFTFRVKIRYLEIINESVRDLLKNNSSNMSTEELLVVPDEWEGMTVKNATWIPCANSQHLLDLFTLGKRNRNTSNSNLGPLHEQSTCILTVEIFQMTSNQATMESTVLASKAHFVDLPCHEKLLDQNSRIREGLFSQSIFALSSVIQGLSRDDRYTDFDQSVCTSLMKDMIGGNCMSAGIFCLQNADPVGSSLVLSHMRMISNIKNYPVVNDSRFLGLLRKYRLDVIELKNQLTNSGSGSIDFLKQRIQDLEKTIQVQNIERLRISDDKDSLNDNVRGLKDSYNKLVKDKADLQLQLIQTEEEKLRNNKLVIELQIRIAELEENHSDRTFSINTRLIQAEKEIKLAQQKEEKSMIAVHDAQEKLIRAVKEKNDVEMEFMALKKNFQELSQKFKEEKASNERLTTEIVNLVNSNSALTNDSEYLSKLKANLSNGQKNLSEENMRLRNQVLKLQEDLLNANTQIDQLKVDLTRQDLYRQREHVDFDNRKLELERGYLQMAHKRDDDLTSKMMENENNSKRIRNQDELLKSELLSVKNKFKSAERKVRELEDHLEEYRIHENEIVSQNTSLQSQLAELRTAYRAALVKNMNEGFQSDAKEELVRSFNAREADLQSQVHSLIAAKSSLIKTVRGLRAYARSLKNLAEDWAPAGHPRPEVLTMPPAMLLEDEDIALDTKAQIRELERLRVRNAQLEQEIKAVQVQYVSNFSTMPKGIDFNENNPQQRLFNEIQMLRAATPGSAKEMENLRKERNDLKEENRKLLQEIRKNSAESSKSVEVEKLKKIIHEMNQRDSKDGSKNGNNRNLQQRLVYLEEVLRKLEKERSELSVRATMAEEQLKNMQDLMDSTVQNYQRKLTELSRKLGK
jgi:kinesin family protein 11